MKNTNYTIETIIRKTFKVIINLKIVQKLWFSNTQKRKNKFLRKKEVKVCQLYVLKHLK
jgi:hypothetical protein